MTAVGLVCLTLMAVATAWALSIGSIRVPCGSIPWEPQNGNRALGVLCPPMVDHRWALRIFIAASGVGAALFFSRQARSWIRSSSTTGA